MKEDFIFENFLLNEEIGLTEYLATAASCRDDDEYARNTEKMKALYKDFPNVEQVLDRKEPVALSEAECEVLIQVLEMKDGIDLLEFRNVYFKGCADAVSYLKMMKLL